MSFVLWILYLGHPGYEYPKLKFTEVEKYCLLCFGISILDILESNISRSFPEYGNPLITMGLSLKVSTFYLCFPLTSEVSLRVLPSGQ